MSIPTTSHLSLPPWVAELVRPYEGQRLKQPMELALLLAEQNVIRETGGPFAAVLVNEDGEVAAVGVNLVVPEQNPTLHGEMVALILGSGKECNFDLSRFTLFSSAEPCAMCAGAIHWAGVCKVYYAATAEDVLNECGFNEGPVHPDWHQWSAEQGVEITHLPEYREHGVRVLRSYAEKGHPIYNAGKS
jgi:tRNA(Arg) A34 adenosine deaminase TadA